jgi:ABC-2 type transport system permease protein
VLDLSAGLARDLKVGLVDLDRSTLSRELAFSLDGSAGLKIAQQFDAIDEGPGRCEGRHLCPGGDPDHLERDARQAPSPG